MKEERLKVVVTIVSLIEPRDSASKIAGAKKILEEAAGFGYRLILFPAGFLVALSEDKVRERARPLISAARKRGIGVVFGVDVGKRSWLTGWVPGMRRAELWSDCDAQPRVLRFSGFSVAVLSEHQLSDARLRAAAAAAEPDLVAICAHLPFNHNWRELERFRRRGLPVLPSHYTFERTDYPPLVCPRGYRPPNLSYRLDVNDVYTLSFFSIDELDGALDAA